MQFIPKVYNLLALVFCISQEHLIAFLILLIFLGYGGASLLFDSADL